MDKYTGDSKANQYLDQSPRQIGPQIYYQLNQNLKSYVLFLNTEFLKY